MIFLVSVVLSNERCIYLASNSASSIAAMSIGIMLILHIMFKGSTDYAQLA